MTYITQKYKQIATAFLLLVAMVANTAQVSAATFSVDLEVMNTTQTSGSSVNWASSTTVDEGDEIGFLITYDNTSSSDAYDTRVKLDLPSTISNGQTITAKIWYGNESAKTTTAKIYTDFSGSRSLTQYTGTNTVEWYTGTGSAKQTLPFSQSGTELVSSNGLQLGCIEAGDGGYIIAWATVGHNGGGDDGSAPTAITRTATNVSYSSATLRGSGDPNDASTTGWFEYGKTTSLGYTSGTVALGSGSSEKDYSVYISGLSQNTTYYYRAVTQNQYGTAYGSIVSFTTNTSYQNEEGPDATTHVASNVSQNGATLNGSVDPNGTYTYAWFEYGTTTSLGHNTATQNVGSSNYSQSVSKNVVNLVPNTTYYYRIVAQNTHGIDYGSIVSFSTGNGSVTGNAPHANTYAVSNIGDTTATMNGTVNPNGYTTTIWFEYGTTTSLGSQSGTVNIGSGTGYVNRYQNLAGLTPNTTYYYRIVGQNAYGTNYGTIVSFTTSGTGGNNYNSIISTLNSIVTRLTLISSSLYQRDTTVITAGTGQVTFTLTADKDQAKAGEEITLTAEIMSSKTLQDGKLVLTLDDDMDCENICGTFPIANFTKEGRIFTFDLGTVSANTVQTYPFKVTVSEDANIDEIITAHGVFSYKDSAYTDRQSLSDSESVEVVSSNGLLASIFGGFDGFLGVLIPLVIAILIAVGLVIVARKIIELVS